MENGNEIPEDANEHCPSPQLESVRKSNSCEGCPNQYVCATAPKGSDLERMATMKHKKLVLFGNGFIKALLRPSSPFYPIDKDIMKLFINNKHGERLRLIIRKLKKHLKETKSLLDLEEEENQETENLRYEKFKFKHVWYMPRSKFEPFPWPLTNGDGIGAIGLTVLVEALVGVGIFNVHVCTPQSDLSVSGHSMSPFETLMVSPIEINGATTYEEVHLVLGRYEGKECTYNNCWLKRQAIFSSFLLYLNGNDGICTACSFSCHGVAQ
ncbi:hypothetical protein IFM89_017132, partial [Coptis chinensis]